MATLTYVPSRIGEGFFIDVPIPGSGDDDKALTYDHATGKFVYVAFDAAGTAAAAVAAHVAASDPHSGYLLAAGTRAGATGQAQSFTSGTKQGKIVVPTDSLTAFAVRNAADSATILSVATSTPSVTISDGAITIAKFANVGNYCYVTTTATNGGFWFDGHMYLTDLKAVGNANFGGGFRFSSGSTWFYTIDTTVFVNFDQNKMVAVGNPLFTPTALIDIAASTTARASLRVREAGTRPTTPNSGDFWNNGAIGSYQINATTNAVVNSLILERASSGTPAAGFGLGIAARLKSSTTEDQDAGRLIFKWGVATHATRSSIGQASAFYTSTEYFPITWGADSSGPLLSFGAVTTPIAIQALATGAGATVDDVIQALQNLGLVKQS